MEQPLAEHRHTITGLGLWGIGLRPNGAAYSSPGQRPGNHDRNGWKALKGRPKGASCVGECWRWLTLGRPFRAWIQWLDGATQGVALGWGGSPRWGFGCWLVLSSPPVQKQGREGVRCSVPRRSHTAIGLARTIPASVAV